MKKKLREQLLKKRDAIPAPVKKQKESSIEKNLFELDEFIKAKTVLLYASFRSEVETGRSINEVLRLGKKLVLPAVDTAVRALRLFEVKNASELVPGYRGIPEPAIRENRQVPLEEIEILIIPGSGFDMDGNRLGYGGGYYDRLLGSRPQSLSRMPVAALAFEEQMAEVIPSEPHDIRVDIIITDRRVIRCSKVP